MEPSWRGRWVTPSTALNKYSWPNMRKNCLSTEQTRLDLGNYSRFMFSFLCLGRVLLDLRNYPCFMFSFLLPGVLCGGGWCGTSGRDGPPPHARRYIPSIERRGRQNNFSDMSLLGEGILLTDKSCKRITQNTEDPAPPQNKSCI